jgi:hypothetical protein
MSHSNREPLPFPTDYAREERHRRLANSQAMRIPRYACCFCSESFRSMDWAYAHVQKRHWLRWRLYGFWYWLKGDL